MIEWIFATIMLIMSAFLFGLCVVIFCFYASKKHKYLLHIALMSSSYLLFAAVIMSQLVAGMFRVLVPNVAIVVAVFLSLALGIGGLGRMWWHRHNEARLEK